MKGLSGKGFYYFRDFIRVLLIALVFSTIFNFWYINQQRDYFQEYITRSAEIRVLTQQVVKYAREGVFDNKSSSFSSLKSIMNEISKELDILNFGKIVNEKLMLPASPEKIKKEDLSRFNEVWRTLESKSNFLLQNQEAISSLYKVGDRFIVSVNSARKSYWDIVNILEKSHIAENKNIVIIARQMSLCRDIMDSVGDVLESGENVLKLTSILSGKVDQFLLNANMVKFETDDAVLNGKFSEIDEVVKSIRLDLNSIKDIGGVIEKIYNLMGEITNMGPVISGLSKNLENAYIDYQKSNNVADFTAYMLGILCFLVLIISIYLLQKESGFHIKLTEEKNKLMQIEVEKLLKELPEIATGAAGVEPVGANMEASMISESFSYALNTLKKLVHSIGRTAQSVSTAALDAQKITKELAAFSGNQAQEIVEVTASVSRMAVSIEEVSTNAAESAEVALDSVTIAGEGGKVVRNTIIGMERIQTQIQETSVYMRRLSDSSQEIGEIVSLIDGIADQTNILSLNASIQAAMAGEAGRGFAVVADEVQRLAEKVSYATKEIGSLVRSIQTDTSQVIVAMEQTKEQVKEGVKFAQDAGGTLEKIETVSRRLSDLIQNISSSASEQALVSGKISHIMNDVKDIAKQTATGTMKTVDLIGKLMQYVTDLRNSVFEL